MSFLHSVTVVGAGPAGLSTALECQKRGWDAVVIEEHAEIGKPVNCTGLISRSGVEETGLDIEKIKLNSVRGARIYSPNHEMLEVKRSSPVAYVIDRAALDQSMAEEAKAAGVKIMLETKLLDIRNETVFVEEKRRGGLLKSKVIVGADGPNSKTRELMEISKKREDFAHAYQVRVNGSFDAGFVELYFGSYAKDFFAWVVPENKEWARVGLATSNINVRESFNIFLKETSLEANYSCDMCSALIPVGLPLKEPVKGNVLLVGDAAFQTKSTTGGGILTGINAGKAAAKAIDDFYKSKKPLTNYSKYLKPINKELELHWKLRKYFNGLSNEKLDKLFVKMRKAKVGEFLSEHGDMDKPSRFIGKVLTRPSMWRMFPEFVSFMVK